MAGSLQAAGGGARSRLKLSRIKDMALRHKDIITGPARAFALCLLALAALAPARAAHAQAIVASVNGDPITTYDVAERAKLLRAIGQPSSPAAALESLIESRVKAGEINKYNIHLPASQLGPSIRYYAEKAHMTDAQLEQRLAAAHVDPKHVENFFGIHEGFNLYARARNRAVEASRADIDAELARDKSISKERTYTLRQVVLIVPPSAGAAGLEAGVKKMQALSAQFTSCDQGPKIAVAKGEFVVRDPITRTSSQLGEQLSALLDKTPLGHLTPPSRDSTGIASVAVCERKAATSDAQRDEARDKVLQRIVDKQAQELYADLRSHAVIVKTGK
jgi:peptidyl-prolyl cis-trans isomerase SurA